MSRRVAYCRLGRARCLGDDASAAHRTANGSADICSWPRHRQRDSDTGGRRRPATRFICIVFHDADLPVSRTIRFAQVGSPQRGAGSRCRARDSGAAGRNAGKHPTAPRGGGRRSGIGHRRTGCHAIARARDGSSGAGFSLECDQVVEGVGVIAREATEPERFRGWIADRLGLNFDDTKLEFLADVLVRRANKKRLALRPYVDRLEGPDSDAELQALVVELTVPETYFFRHIDQLHALADVALPEAQTRRGPLRTLSVLSVGCASGEEPYSLAMLVRERGVGTGWNVAIRAVDVNPTMLAKAARGVYSAWALRETPTTSQQRWFKSVGREFLLEESIRAAVTFQEVNLAQEEGVLKL